MSVSINVNGNMNGNINQSQNKNTLFAGNLFGSNNMTMRERIEQKRQLYAKQGNKIVQDADAVERKVDKLIQDARDRAKEYIAQVDEYQKEMADIDKQLAKMQESYNVEEGSQEQKDLELLLKEQRLEPLTEEEQERRAMMGEPTEYQKRALELYKTRDYDYKEAEKLKLKASGETAGARQIQISRLEEHGMIDAQKSKEELMQAASKEIMGMVVQDAKDKIDEKAEETKEEAEKREEEKEELEERVEAAKENKSESEAQAEAVRENVEELTQQMTKGDDINADIQSEMKQLLEEQKLMMEELKGLVVDKTV